MIVGAGTGGLCLAQGLKDRGIATEVFERDKSPRDRLQGYRLSINADGSHALKSCLPDSLYAEFVARSAAPSRGLTFLDQHLRRLLAIDLQARAAPERELPVSRTVLRELLLKGLGEIVQLDKKFTHYEDVPGGKVVAHFEDGATAVGDLLIGADGASSRVRAQLLPHAKRVETGLVIVSGKLPLTDAVRQMAPKPFFRGPTLILGPKGCFLFGNAVEYGVTTGLSEAREEEYVMWGFSARRPAYGLGADPQTAGGERLRAAVAALMKDWHPELKRLIETTDSSQVDGFPAKTSVPVPPWSTRNVTLLGDALHNMTPFRGIGANTALRDAAALCRTLVAVNRGQQALLPALSVYEREMIEYGFAAVRASLKDMHRLHAESLLSRTLTKTFLRTLDLIPPLRPLVRA